MTTFTVRRPDLFPDGTSVAAYVAATAGPGGIAPTSGAPAGSVVETQVAAGGALVFSSLAARTSYVLYASSPDRYLRLNTSAGGSVYPELSGDPADDQYAVGAGTGTHLPVTKASVLRLDVRDWAAGVGASDYALNTAALRGMAAAVKASGGGIVWVPFDDFGVDCSANIPMEQSPGAAVIYEGLTHNALSSADVGSRIKRMAGTLDVFSFVGTGTTGPNRAHGGWRHLEIDGGGQDARIGIFDRCNELDIPYLRVIGGSADNTDYGGVDFQQVWNTFIPVMSMYRCGGTSKQVMHLKSHLADSFPGCDSLMIGQAKFEACHGTEIISDSGGVGPHNVEFGQLWMERQLTAMTWRMVDLIDTFMRVGSLYMSMSPADGTAPFIRQDSTDGSIVPEFYVGKGKLTHGGAPSEFIDVKAGYFMWPDRQLRMIGTPSTANSGTGKYVKIASTIAQGRVGPGRALLSDVTKYASDARTYGSNEPLGSRTIPCSIKADPGGSSSEIVPTPATGTGTTNGTTSVTSVVQSTGTFVAGQTITGTGIPAGTTISAYNSGTGVITLSQAATASGSGVALTSTLDACGITMSGTADSKLFFRFAAPVDADAFGAGFLVRVRGTIDGQPGTPTGTNMRINAKVHKVQSGVALTSGTNTATTATVTPPSVSALREVLLSIGTTITRGDEVQGVINRFAASDGADDWTGRFIVTGVDVIVDR